MNPHIQALQQNLDLSQNKTLKELVYEAFRKTIILGEIPAGSRINEKEFSDVLNISRTPIRYAMTQLVKEQLVEHVPRVGIVVKGISIRDAYEIYDIRKALDTMATIKAMQNMTETEFDELKALLEYGDKLNSEDKVEEVLQNFSDFNAFIYEKSQMKRLRSIVLNLQAYLVYFRDVAIRSSERRHEALREHWLIYRGMRTNDVEQITMITQEHLERSLNFIVTEMGQRRID